MTLLQPTEQKKQLTQQKAKHAYKCIGIDVKPSECTQGRPAQRSGIH